MSCLGEASEARKVLAVGSLGKKQALTESCDRRHLGQEAEVAKKPSAFPSHSHQSKERCPRGRGFQDHPTRDVHKIQTEQWIVSFLLA